MHEQLQLPIRNAGLFTALRAYVHDAFQLLRDERAAGADLTFSVEEHRQGRDHSPFYEYRPMTERFVRERAAKIWELPSADEAAWVVASDPAASAWLRHGRADVVADLEDVARTELLLPMLVAQAERSPTFEFDEPSLLSAYLRFEKALYAKQRRYVAAIPLWSIRLLYGDLELAPGVRIVQVDPELMRMEWPEAAQLNWGAQSPDGQPMVMLEFERAVGADDESAVLDPLPAVSQVVSAIRALAGGGVYAGPFILERLDYRTLAPRPVPAQAASRCGQLPSKVDGSVASHLPQAVRRLSSDPDGTLARILDRYQYAASTGGMPALRAIVDSIVEVFANGNEPGLAALRMAGVVGAAAPERREIIDAMTRARTIIAVGTGPREEMQQLTRLLAAGLRATIAAALVGSLPITSLQEYADGVMLGDRERIALGATALHHTSSQ